MGGEWGERDVLTEYSCSCAFQGVFAVFVLHVVQDLIGRPLQVEVLVRALSVFHVFERFDHFEMWSPVQWPVRSYSREKGMTASVMKDQGWTSPLGTRRDIAGTRDGPASFRGAANQISDAQTLISGALNLLSGAPSQSRGVGTLFVAV